MEQNYFLRLNKILFVTFVILVRGQTESEIGKSKNPSILRNDHNHDYFCLATRGERHILIGTQVDGYTKFHEHSTTDKQYQTRPTRVIIHGYTAFGYDPGWLHHRIESRGFLPEFESITEKVYLDMKKYNVLKVHWIADRHSTIHDYDAHVRYAKDVGKKIAEKLDRKLKRNAERWRELRIIGNSLGAHVAGFVGKSVKNGKVGTIIGLDPAHPQFEGKPPKDRLDKGDAEYVECIHTGPDCFGIRNPICTADFYPNKGRGLHQPACRTTGVWNNLLPPHRFLCDHFQAFDFYTESLSSNKFHAWKCEPWKGFEKSKCNGKPGPMMGGDPGNFDKNLSGWFYLETNSKPPYAQGRLKWKYGG